MDLRTVTLHLLVACLVARVSVGGLVVSTAGNPGPDDDVENDHGEADALMTVSDQERIEVLQDQIVRIQNAVAEIMRSFSTLDLVAKNPSMMKKLGVPDDVALRYPHGDDDDESETGKARSRRDVDSPLSALPTGASTSSNSAQSHLGLGPYAWPMFSGQCFLCPAGVAGPRGPPGQVGVAGRDGRDGRDAQLEPSSELPSRPHVPVRNPTDEEPIGATRRPVNGQPSGRPQDVNSSSSGGAVYVRWGNSECADGSELIYAGTVGSSYYSHTGSGSNYLCLPDEPIYDETETSVSGDRALLYSSEYETSSAPERLRSAHDNTPTCAVCRAPSGRSSQLMIPARNVCPSDDWRLEYAGYLMSTKYTLKKSEYICMDREMEAEPGSTGNQHGAMLYMVEGRCLNGGGLPCGPYVNGYELTCAVCTI